MIGQERKVLRRTLGFASGWIMSVVPLWLLALVVAAGPAIAGIRIMREQSSVGGAIAMGLELLLPFWSAIKYGYISLEVTAIVLLSVGVLALVVFKWLTGLHDFRSGIYAGLAWATLVGVSAFVSGGVGWLTPTVLLWRPVVGEPIGQLLLESVVGVARAGLVSFLLFGIMGNWIATLAFNRRKTETRVAPQGTEADYPIG